MKLFTEYPEKNEREYSDRVVQLVKQQMKLLYGNADPIEPKQPKPSVKDVSVRVFTLNSHAV